jgi:hypothetical protein
MEVKLLLNIIKKDSLLFYRNEYNAEAVFIYGGNKTEETVPVNFIVEKTAVGVPKISSKILKHINYPMLGAGKKLQEHVKELDKRGHLP